jgi:hypothetical protein
MGVKIHVPAEEIWSFFQKNKSRLVEEMVVVAENDETEYAVYITEGDGYPCLSVCKGREAPEYEEGAINAKDCMDTADRCFKQYLFPVTVTTGDKRYFPSHDFDDDVKPMNYAQQEKEDAVYEREDELQLAICDFLQVTLQDGCDGREVMDIYGLEMVDEILNSVLQSLAHDYGFPVYRPTLYTDEATGEDEYTEYPYNDDIDDDIENGDI